MCTDGSVFPEPSLWLRSTNGRIRGEPDIGRDGRAFGRHSFLAISFAVSIRLPFVACNTFYHPTQALTIPRTSAPTEDKTIAALAAKPAQTPQQSRLCLPARRRPARMQMIQTKRADARTNASGSPQYLSSCVLLSTQKSPSGAQRFRSPVKKNSDIIMIAMLLESRTAMSQL